MTADSAFHLFKRAGPAVRAMLDGLGHRAQLALLELGELKTQVASSLVLGAVALVLSLLGGIAMTFAIAASVWHRPDRGLWLTVLTLGYFLVAAILALVMARRLKRLAFLPETTRQLSADRHCIDALLNPEKPPHPVS